MQEFYVMVQRGFRILLSSMSGYIGQTLNKKYGDMWWNEVMNALQDQRDLKFSGTYEEHIDSLDIANCIRIIDRMWNEDFKSKLIPNCRTWAKELMGVRNIVSHIGQQDLDQPLAERALDTMALLCKEIDPDGAEELREVYKEVRSRAESTPATVIYAGVSQPESRSKRGELKEGSLLKLVGTDKVEKTALTRKVTYGGSTEVYPVYRVRLDCLYYNDQNDRISTWISQYEAENGSDSLSELDADIYNRIIENFVYESNPDSIAKTQNNISGFGQREPGVTLADGRIVDGNRRYTCLRRIQRESSEPVYFETVIMDMDIREDKKQIKQLELAIQHGEEKKVDYDLIDYAVGTYKAVVIDDILTVDEYAASTNEPVAEVKKRLEIAGIICEFLEHIKLPEKFHIAREYQVYSLFQEMMTPLRSLGGEDKQTLKITAFDNAIMQAIPDQRKFIRDIKNLVKNDAYTDYFEDQKRFDGVIMERFGSTNAQSKEDIDRFALENKGLAEEMRISMETALQRMRSKSLKDIPSVNVSKSIDLLMEIDPRLFAKMDEDEKEELRTKLDEVVKLVGNFRKSL